MRKGVLCLLVFGSLFLVLPWANAQAGAVDVAIGFGTVHDKSNGTGLDYNDLSSCSVSTDPACSTSSSHLSGLMMGFTGDYMLRKHYGFGAEVSFQPAQQTYVSFNAISPGESINSRMIFYDFNGVARPVSTKHAALQFEGGLGGANLRFYDNISGSSIVGNVNSSQYLSSSNHFQLHVSAEVPIYLKGGFFIRPQFDFHYVPNLNQQYNSDVVTQGMVYVGYSFGGE